MVSHIALAVVTSLLGTQEQDYSTYNRVAKRILSKAYSATESQAPASLFGPEEPQIRKARSGNGLLLIYANGSVGFNTSDQKPNYFVCHLKPNMRLETPMSATEIGQRVIHFVREFAPHKAFQIERDKDSINLRILEQGIPHFYGCRLQVDPFTGVITFGGFPPEPPIIARVPHKNASKEYAVAEALHTVLSRDSELETFEVVRMQSYWLVPSIEYSETASIYARNAAKERKAIKVYCIGILGERLSEGAKSRKNGVIWIDAENGKALSGRLMKIDGASIANVQPLTRIQAPQSIFFEKRWQPILKADPTNKVAPTISGTDVFAMNGSVVVKAKFDTKKKTLWLPTKSNKWTSFLIRL